MNMVGQLGAAEMLLINLTVINLHFLLPFAVNTVARHNLCPVAVREPLRVDSKVCDCLPGVFKGLGSTWTPVLSPLYDW